MNLAAHVVGMAGFFRVRAVDGIGWHSLALQIVHGLVQFLAMTVGPQDDAVPVRLQHFQCLNREGHGLTYTGIPVFHHGTVKIDCDE